MDQTVSDYLEGYRNAAEALVALWPAIKTVWVPSSQVAASLSEDDWGRGNSLRSS
jgi:hypothetical protein